MIYPKRQNLLCNCIKENKELVKYILRLDDATPKMNKSNWIKIEEMLDKYGVKPLVGIIPDCEDYIINWDYDESFWTEIAPRWVSKGWTIAQHGYKHVFQLDLGIYSEFNGLSYEKQKEKIEQGYDFMKNRGIIPTCFFSPAHQFDNNTISVCRDSGHFDFISDGTAFYPYKENGMLFIPCMFDTPHKMPFGIYTFVLHPNYLNDAEFEYYENFIRNNKDNFINAYEALENINLNRKRNVFEFAMKKAFKTIRKIKSRKDGN